MSIQNASGPRASSRMGTDIGRNYGMLRDVEAQGGVWWWNTVTGTYHVAYPDAKPPHVPAEPAEPVPFPQSPLDRVIGSFRGSDEWVGRPIWFRDLYFEGGKPYYDIQWSICENIFDGGRQIEFLQIKLDEDIIYGPGARSHGMSMRLQNGIGNTPDPYIVQREGHSPAYTGRVSVRLRRVPADRYDRGLPVLRARVSDASDAAGTQISIPYDPLNGTDNVWEEDPGAVDWGINHFYRLMQDYDATNDPVFYISTLSFTERRELFRVRIQAGYYWYDHINAVPGTGYLFAAAYVSDGNDTIENVLIDSATGAIIASAGQPLNGSAALWGDGVAFQSRSGTKFLFAGQIEVHGGITGSPMGVALVDPAEPSVEILGFGDFGETWFGSAQTTIPGRSFSGFVSFYTILSNMIFELSWDGNTIQENIVYQPPQGLSVTGAYYEPIDDTLLVSLTDLDATFESGNRSIVKLDTEDYSVILSAGMPDWVSLASRGYYQGVGREMRSGFAFAMSWFFITSPQRRFFAVDTATLDLIEYDQPAWVGRGSPTGHHFSQVRGAFYQYYSDDDDNWVEYRVGFGVPGKITRRSLIESVVDKAGISSGSLVFNAPFDTLMTYGYRFDTMRETQDYVRQICEPLDISIVERPGGLKFLAPIRDGNLVLDFELSKEELVESGEMRATIQGRIASDTDQPSRLDISYIGLDEEFDRTSMPARLGAAVFGPRTQFRHTTISTSEIMDADIAAEMATLKLQAWQADKENETFTVGPAGVNIDPGSVGQITVADETVVVRVRATTLNPDLSQSMETGAFLLGGETILAGGTREPRPVAVRASGACRYVHADLPLVFPYQDTGGTALLQQHVITGRGQDNWELTGGNGYRSLHGSTYDQFATMLGSYPIYGVVTDPLAAPTETFDWDESGSLTIRVTAGGDNEILPGDVFAIGAPGRWMVCRVSLTESPSPIEHNEDGTITITGIAQGGFGTEVHEGAGQAGDEFFVIRPEFIGAYEYDVADLGRSYFFKAAGSDQDIDDVPAQRRVISGEAERPFAPWQLETDYLESPEGFSLSWARRDRREGFWPSEEAPPLSEPVELYDVQVLDAEGEVVAEEFNHETTSIFFDAMESPAPAPSPTPPIRWRVRQVTELSGGTRHPGHWAEFNTLT
jgi:hypothetical protein